MQGEQDEAWNRQDQFKKMKEKEENTVEIDYFVHVHSSLGPHVLSFIIDQ